MIKIYRNEHEKVAKYASIRNKTNAAVYNSLDKKQHTALAIVANMRHELHGTGDWYFSVPLEERKRTFNFFSKLMPILLRTAGLPQMEIHMDLLERKITCNNNDEAKEAIEKINTEIEGYLSKVDQAYGTEYCPTGIRRQRRKEAMITMTA